MTQSVLAIGSDKDQRLAWELVAQISPLPDILRRHGLTYDDLKNKLREPLFRSLVAETKRIWKSDLNTKERIRIKAALLVEDSMLEMYGVVHNRELSPQARIDAFESLVGIADLKPDKNGSATGERVVINISVPGIEKPVVIDSHAVEHANERSRDTGVAQ